VTVPRPKSDHDDHAHQGRFTTRAQADFRRGGARRMGAAAAVVLIGLALLVLLGPDENVIKEKFEYYGAPDELRIMPEISIEDGRDAVDRELKLPNLPPPPADIEVVREDPVIDGTVEVPKADLNEQEEFQELVQDPADFTSEDDRSQAELARPMQSNPDFYILKLVRPDYPSGATEAERRIPRVYVQVAVFVGPDGLVTDTMVMNNTGTRIYELAAIEAVMQWQFGWRVDPGVGRWIRIPWNFKSPYFTPDRNGR
jgi:TonB family protein